MLPGVRSSVHEFKSRFSPLLAVLGWVLMLGGAAPVSVSSTTVTTSQPSVSFGSVALRASSGSKQSISFTVPSGITLGGISALTLGAPNLDFTVTGGTCANATTNTSCTVQVQFLPTAVGTRQGALVLSDQSGNTLILVLLVGTGTGPMVAFGPGIITTVAGNGSCAIRDGYGICYSGDGGLATSAELWFPADIAFDGAGDLYIADSAGDDNRIRKVTNGIINTVAGVGTSGYNGDNIQATTAELSGPRGIVVDGAGNLCIADSGNNRIRKVTPGGIISTVAGNGTAGYGGDGGPATSAELNNPTSVAMDGAGSLYIADTGNNRIRSVSPGGTITTVAGNGTAGSSGDGGPATKAEFYYPAGVAVDGAGNLYIGDTGNNRVRMVAPGGVITTVAGNGYGEGGTGSGGVITGSGGFSGDGGPATSAELNNPEGVAVDGAGNLYIADSTNHRIRKVTPGGIITTVAGDGGCAELGLGEGNCYNGDNITATSAYLRYPSNVVVDTVGNLYIADYWNWRVRKMDVSDPPAFNFDSIFVGDTSAPIDVSVLNLGNTTLDIPEISTALPYTFTDPYTSCSATGQTLASAASCGLGIEFKPTEIGPYSGSVVLTDNTLNLAAATQTIRLNGDGVQPQTITFPNPGTQTYGVPPITLKATASSNLPVSYEVISGPAAVSGSTLTITGGGVVTVQASQNGNADYGSATPVSVTFTVNPATQIITFPNPGTQTFGVAPITLKASASSNLAVSYAVTWGPARVSGSTLTLTEPGLVTVEATQAGNADYAAATPVSITFTVTPGTPTYSSGNFGSVAVGAATGSTHTFSFTIPSGTILETISVLTSGAPNLDFTVTGGTCAKGTTNTTCTVQVQFLPKFAGTRLGGMVLTGESGAPLITFPLYGTGLGPQTIFLPATQTNLGFNASSVAVDGSGNLYVVASAAVYKETLQANGSYTQTPIGSGFYSPSGVAVDGSGNVYVSDFGNNDGVDTPTHQAVYKETLQADGTYIQTTIGSGFYGPAGVAVDGSGNVYIADNDTMVSGGGDLPPCSVYCRNNWASGSTAPPPPSPKT